MPQKMLICFVLFCLFLCHVCAKYMVQGGQVSNIRAGVLQGVIDKMYKSINNPSA